MIKVQRLNGFRLVRFILTGLRYSPIPKNTSKDGVLFVFKVVYRRHTNFAMEAIEQTSN